MQFGIYCCECVVKRYARLLRKQKDPEKARTCMLEMMDVIAHAPANVAAPYLIHLCDGVFAKYFHREDRYAEIKRVSNEYLLAKLPELRKDVLSKPDPLYAALQYARLCNYIDYGPLGGLVDFSYLDELLAKAADEEIDEAEYGRFTADLDRAEHLLYICDNAGEIVADRLVLEILRERFPKLDVCVCVRGGPVINDAVREDAKTAGIEEYARLIDNGSTISGTQLQFAGRELTEEIAKADVILSKGQGNFETMHGCGYNVYYAFLCKCEWFTKQYRVPMLKGLFVNENRLTTYPVED